MTLNLEFNEKQQKLSEKAKQILQAKYIDVIHKGRENVTILCERDDCKKEIYKHQTLVIDSQGHFLHPYCYFAIGIPQKTYDRLKTIPEDITNLEDCIDFLIKFYFQHQDLSKDQKTLSSEEGL